MSTPTFAQLAKRFWAVIAPNGEVWATSVSHHRSRARDRFMTHSRYGYLGGSWRTARRQGYRLRRVRITPI